MMDFLLGIVANTLPWVVVPVLAFFVACLFFGGSYEAELNRKHFGRERFAAWVDEGGKLHIECDPPRDHAQRCQDYYRDRNLVKPKLIFFAALFVECLIGLMI